MDAGSFYIVKVYITIIGLLGNAVDFSHIRNLFSSFITVHPGKFPLLTAWVSVTAENHADSLINKEHDH